MIPLGEPGTKLSDEVEQPALAIETGPHSDNFRPARYAGERFVVRFGGNDAIPTAEVRLSIADVLLDPEFTPPTEAPLIDWQIRTFDRQARNPWEHLLGGKRIRIGTNRSEPGDDWLLFEGFIDNLEIAWSGSSRQARTLTLFATDTIIAADREPSQHMIGQWRRNRASAIAGEPQYIRCVRIPVPLIFNPGGKPNCHPMPLVFDDESHVYVFTDVEDPDAIPWTLAKALRYIQWAALQVAPPVQTDGVHDRVDVWYQSDLTNIAALPWTSWPIEHHNLSELIEPLLDEPPDSGTGPYGRAALLRALPSLACNGMSSLESFAYLCDRAGILMHVFHEYTPMGLGLTKLAFKVRGYRAVHPQPVTNVKVGAIGRKQRPGQPDPTPEEAPEEPAAPQWGAAVAGAYLSVPSDRTDSDDLTDIERMKRTNATEGRLLFDESRQCSSVRVYGDPVQHEMTMELRPGWAPDDWWDIDPDDEQAVDDAVARLPTRGDPDSGAEWKSRYVTNQANFENQKLFGKAGRYWVLNEDGAFKPSTYQRSYGPFSQASLWEPYSFRNEGGLSHLEVRGDDGWTIRRRRLLPTIARESGDLGTSRKLGIIVQLSFESGAPGTWFRNACTCRHETDRCAITVTVANLADIILPSDPDDNFAKAYIEGRLRVRVTANIEGDDFTVGYAASKTGPDVALPWRESLDRKGRYGRKLRRSASSSLISTFPYPGDDDGVMEADALALRVRNELIYRRTSGQVTVPYLLRHQPGVPWDTYEVGDEIDGIHTFNPTTNLTLARGEGAERVGPRVIGMTYAWNRNPDEISTTITIEDRTYSPDDLEDVSMEDEA